MRVLWVCNIMLPAAARALGQESSVREGWLSGLLGEYLEATEGREPGLVLGLCFPASGRLAQLSEELPLGQKGERVACYGFAEDLEHPERYDEAMEGRFRQILEAFQPDLVHIFGTEFPHACACAKVWNRPERTLVGLQGLCCACSKDYMADLPLSVQNSRTFRDILKRDSLRRQQEKFALRAQNEEKLLRLAGHVTGRTEFDKTIALRINPSAKYYKMNETMRPDFYQGGWDIEKCRPFEIFVSQADYPLKGFHYLLQAMKEILQFAPEAHIRVAGNSVLGVDGIKSRIKLPAYGKYLRRLIWQNGLEGKVEALGRLDAGQMKEAYLSCRVFVCPSAVENSPNSVAEAQLLGVPVVASRAGGIPSLVEDQIGGLLFEKGDVCGLARCVLSLMKDDGLARRLSGSERAVARRQYSGADNYRRLLEIYREMA
ncbi:MAG: glycosyltransferase [Eubacteriales bacterium]|nr:glycosyltransferase [Eubacteriales bacterium]